jgi:hypothetical protein
MSFLLLNEKLVDEILLLFPFLGSDSPVRSAWQG